MIWPVHAEKVSFLCSIFPHFHIFCSPFLVPPLSYSYQPVFYLSQRKLQQNLLWRLKTSLIRLYFLFFWWLTLVCLVWLLPKLLFNSATFYIAVDQTGGIYNSTIHKTSRFYSIVPHCAYYCNIAKNSHGCFPQYIDNWEKWPYVCPKPQQTLSKQKLFLPMFVEVYDTINDSNIFSRINFLRSFYSEK